MREQLLRTESARKWLKHRKTFLTLMIERVKTLKDRQDKGWKWVKLYGIMAKRCEDLADNKQINLKEEQEFDLLLSTK